MPVILTDSVCNNCKWIDSCMVFKKLNGIADNRKFKTNTNHYNDVVEIIIRRCTIYNYDRSYK